MDPFVHLHVASGYSLQYGASHPPALVERAAEQEMDTLALTDRDGVYGAVKFVQACRRAGIRPVLGVDLAYAVPDLFGRPAPARRTPVRGGEYRDLRLPRVTLLATGKAGWASLCRLVSATHYAGERGDPVTTPELVAAHAEGLLVLLGPGSTLGRAAAERRDDHAAAVLERWRGLVDPSDLLVELVSHRLPGSGPGTSAHAARMAGVARQAGIGVVLSNAVRYADRLDAPTVDVLDAARRLVPLDLRHVDRGNAEGYLKSGKQMAEVAEEICRMSGIGSAAELTARTRAVADRCGLDPREDLGIGEVFFPELEVTGTPQPGLTDADAELRRRCEGGLGWRYPDLPMQRVWKRLGDELELIRRLGYASYFLTVGDITTMIREMGVRSAARGSGAGSLVNYLLGVSGVDPIRHELLMERFLSDRRSSLPDIDIDVESARRPEIYEAILARYGSDRVACVSMMDTYRVRHAVRDVGAALGMPPGETDAIAKAFPHIRARDARTALRELPELRASGLAEERLDLMFRLVERLDGLPRHVALHPCGVLLSDLTLLDRTPVERSAAGYPMSHFDKDDVEEMGLLKLDVLGIRMQSAMAHAVAEIARVDGEQVDLDDETQVPFDDPETYRLISESRTLGVFQIESPGQRELVGKSGIEGFSDIITDISLFRPGPVKSDMITPYLNAKQGWNEPSYLHEDLRPILSVTHGVVVFHEQVIEMIATFAGVSNAEGDEKRRALGTPDGMEETKAWFFPRALGKGYPLPVVEEVWRVLAAFASFGFCKAHAAAFALPTFQSAWLKTHWPAHFLAGVLTHDPGMYPKRLILDDARQCGVAVLPLDVNASEATYAVERLPGDGAEVGAFSRRGPQSQPPLRSFVAPGGQAHPRSIGPLLPEPPTSAPSSAGSAAYVASGGDTGGDGSAYGIRLALAEVKGINDEEVSRIVAGRPYASLTDFWHRARVSRPVAERLVEAGAFDTVYGIGPGRSRAGRVTTRDLLLQVAELDRFGRALDRAARGRGLAWGGPTGGRSGNAGSVQLPLDLGDAPGEGELSGLPEMQPEDRMRAELEILGLDASRHVLETYQQFLDELGVARSRDLLTHRSKADLLVAGVKVATQTPPIRTGRRVVFLTLDDGTGPVDATFFSDAQGPYASTVFGSWLLVVRGELRRTGRRGVSLRATGCWELSDLHALWRAAGGGAAGVEAVRARIAEVPEPLGGPAPERTRVLVHSSGFRMSPYSDIKPAGDPAKDVARKLWHRSPGSAG